MQLTTFKDVSDNKDILLAREAISKMHFEGIEKYDVSTILSVPFFSWDKEKIRKLNNIKAIIKSLHCTRNVSINRGENILFFESVEYMERDIYQQMLRKVESCIEKNWIIRSTKRIRVNFGAIKYGFTFFKWKKTMAQAVKDPKFCGYLTLCLLRAYIELEKFTKEVHDSKPDVIITFCDVHLVDAIIVQWGKINGIKTVTLQHGHFNAKDRGWVFGRSKSDFFLLQGNYARDEALASGHSAKGLITVGMMNYIGKPRHAIQPIQQDRTCFAVLLNGPGAKEDNAGFLMCATEIAKKYNLQYVMRMHPTIPKDEYEGYYLSEYCCGDSKPTETLEQLVSRTRFVLVGNSTMFIEALYVGGVAFRYLGLSQDIYDKIGWCSFANVEEFCHIYEQCVSNPSYLEEQAESSLNQLCAPGDIAYNYATAIKDISNEEKIYENSRDYSSEI